VDCHFTDIDFLGFVIYPDHVDFTLTVARVHIMINEVAVVLYPEKIAN
jgi:hypothetical protein